MLPLPPIAEPFTDLLRAAYRGKAPGSLARFKDEEVQDLSAFHSFVALNQAIALEPANYSKLKRRLEPERLTEPGMGGDRPRRDIRGLLRAITVDVIGSPELSIPFASEGRALDDTSIYNVLQRIKGSSRAEIRAVETEMRGYGALLEEAYSGLPAGAELPAPVDTRSDARRRFDEERASRPVVVAPEVRVEGGGAPAKPLSAMNLAELQAEAERLGLSTLGSKKELKARIQAAR
jgi:hypothetical protein